MRIQDQVPQQHVDGYIFVGASDGDDPQFSVTLRHHGSADDSGAPPRYMVHPIESKLKRGGKIQSIPVKVIYDTPASNIAARYEAWSADHIHGPSCIGDGDMCKRYDHIEGKWDRSPCRGPATCPHANQPGMNCSITVRMSVQIDAEGEGAIFELRSSSYNTYQSILGTLSQLKAEYGGLRGLPLELTPWFKSGRASDYNTFTCVAIGMRPGATIPQMAPQNADREERGKSVRAAWLGEITPTDAELAPVGPSHAHPQQTQRVKPTQKMSDQAEQAKNLFEQIAIANTNAKSSSVAP